jgi:hypothetical protein
MNNWRQILSWNEANTIPVNESSSNETKFIALIINELRKKGYKKYVVAEEMKEFLTGWLEDLDSEEDVFSLWIDSIFSTPQQEAKGWAITYLDIMRDNEEEI